MGVICFRETDKKGEKKSLQAPSQNFQQYLEKKNLDKKEEVFQLMERPLYEVIYLR